MYTMTMTIIIIAAIIITTSTTIKQKVTSTIIKISMAKNITKRNTTSHTIKNTKRSILTTTNIPFEN